MGWIYPGQAVCRADGSSSEGFIRAMAEGPNGTKSVLVAWVTGGETWEPMASLMLLRKEAPQQAS